MICGIDEAGRGPLAGPVCAAAVVLPENFSSDILNDSKKLNPKQRDELRHIITSEAITWGIGWASHTEIDEINILQASLLAMKRAFEFLLVLQNREGDWHPETETSFGKPFSVFPTGLNAIVDGLYTPALPVPCKALIKADASVREVMAASILAKTARDHLMEHYDKLYPQYGYKKHKGYPTKEHRKLILQNGPSPIQRMSFNYKLKTLL